MLELYNTKDEALKEADIRNKEVKDNPKFWSAIKVESGHWQIVWRWK